MINYKNVHTSVGDECIFCLDVNDNNVILVIIERRANKSKIWDSGVLVEDM